MSYVTSFTGKRDFMDSIYTALSKFFSVFVGTWGLSSCLYKPFTETKHFVVSQRCVLLFFLVPSFALFCCLWICTNQPKFLPSWRTSKGLVSLLGLPTGMGNLPGINFFSAIGIKSAIRQVTKICVRLLDHPYICNARVNIVPEPGALLTFLVWMQN